MSYFYNYELNLADFSIRRKRNPHSKNRSNRLSHKCQRIKHDEVVPECQQPL